VPGRENPVGLYLIEPSRRHRRRVLAFIALGLLILEHFRRQRRPEAGLSGPRSPATVH
jgi:hypothetical protein